MDDISYSQIVKKLWAFPVVPVSPTKEENLSSAVLAVHKETGIDSKRIRDVFRRVDEAFGDLKLICYDREFNVFLAVNKLGYVVRSLVISWPPTSFIYANTHPIERREATSTAESDRKELLSERENREREIITAKGIKGQLYRKTTATRENRPKLTATKKGRLQLERRKISKLRTKERHRERRSKYMHHDDRCGKPACPGCHDYDPYEETPCRGCGSLHCDGRCCDYCGSAYCDGACRYSRRGYYDWWDDDRDDYDWWW